MRGIKIALVFAIGGWMVGGANVAVAGSSAGVAGCVTPKAESRIAVSPLGYIPVEPSPDRLVGSAVTETAATTASAGTISVYLHVIHHGLSGAVPDSEIDAQFDVLNAAFAPFGIQFRLESTDRTDSDAWFNQVTDGSKAELQVKSALRRGSADDLNIYTTNITDGHLGWSSFPWEYARNPKDDGVVLAFGTLPGGPTAPYNLGDTAVREVGAWLGLLNTFQGGCNERKGDLVADTPAEKTPAYDCQEGRDTCRAPGTDPVHNFMDFSTDACRDHFTAGQGERMNEMFALYRAGK